MHATKQSTTFLVILLLLIGASALAAYYRYIVTEEFDYFVTEDEIPERFDPSTYL